METNRSMPQRDTPGASTTPIPPTPAPAPPDSADAPPVEAQRPLVADELPADRPPDALQQARDSIAAGELGAAMATLRALISREPKNARARAALAELLERKGDVEGALGELGRALDAAPEDVTILCARAALYTARGRYDQAELDLPAGSLQPEDIGAVRLGMALRGYRMSEVDGLLDRVVAELADRDARLTQLEASLGQAQAHQAHQAQPAHPAPQAQPAHPAHPAHPAQPAPPQTPADPIGGGADAV